MIVPTLICIGASAGGIHAIQNLLAALKGPAAQPIVIAQHLPADADIDLQLIFGGKYKGQVIEIVDKMPLSAGTAYFAPPAYHTLINRDHHLSLSQDELVNYARPSIDVLFDSAAWAYGAKSCGIVLTGANDDGAEGLAAIARAGGVTIVQDPEDAEARTMPQAAINRAQPQMVLSLAEIAAKIMSWTEAV
jgi:two-component system chemotaxis response regulator CheB